MLKKEIGDATILQGDCVEILKTLPAESVQCCVTSPPYWGLRDYGVEGQIGLEETPQDYVAAMVKVFSEVKRVLREDGVLWLNLGDSYAARVRQSGAKYAKSLSGKSKGVITERVKPLAPGLREKDLMGIPWRVAFALQDNGWYLRSDIVWSKPNPMPESVKDRPTRSHEYVFMMTKNPKYYYDADSVREPLSEATKKRDKTPRGRRQNGGGSKESMGGIEYTQDLGNMQSNPAGRNRRTVWEVATKSFKGAHFAVYPTKLIEPCILAGSRPGDTVLDPFNGSGTTGIVALAKGRKYIGCELNPEYVDDLTLPRLEAIRERAPLFNALSANSL